MKKVVKVIAIIVAIMLVIGVVYTIHTLWGIKKIDETNIYSGVNEISKVYDNDGKVIDSLYFSEGKREIIKYSEIPEDMVNAIIAVEDKKFWKHHGFNFIRTIGAIRDSIFNGGRISGTSTITQQLARNLYLSEVKSERTLDRKIKEAYYAMSLERHFSKQQILEAYLNTVYFGGGNYGISMASNQYFSKDVKDLELIECVALASLPKSPDTYALVKTSNPDGTLSKVASSRGVTYYYNGEKSKDRRAYILKEMKDNGDITAEEYEKASKESLKEHICLKHKSSVDPGYSYFVDYMLEQLADQVSNEYNMSKSDAYNYIYTGGLDIYTTLDTRIQKIMHEEMNKSSNYTSIGYYRPNSEGNIVTSGGSVMAYRYTNLFNSSGDYTLKASRFKKDDNGNLILKTGKELAFYNMEVEGVKSVTVNFKDLYKKDGSVFSLIEGGEILIPAGYTKKDNDGNCIIKAQFFKDYPQFFVKDGSDYVIKSKNIALNAAIPQPQGAAVFIENGTGKVLAMTGGRNAEGRKLYNRAVNPRQPGSCMKPIGVYGPALQKSKEYADDSSDMNLSNADGANWGDYITAGSIVKDSPIRVNGKYWPKNAYYGSKGYVTIRRAVEQSINTCAVKTLRQIGVDYSVRMLEKQGITTLDTEGTTNDLNLAALALGGMTNGISPLEMAAAYSVFPNKGVYIEPILYTKVEKNGHTLFEADQKYTEVYDPGIAWIMTDILRTVVTNGIGSPAAIGTQPVGGKTGTTSDAYDIWFSGFTPQYTMALWEGNDINISLYGGSSYASRFWSKIMKRACEGLDRGEFFERPDNVLRARNDYAVEGTANGYRPWQNNYNNNYYRKKTEEKEETTTPSSETPTQGTTSEPQAETEAGN